MTSLNWSEADHVPPAAVGWDRRAVLAAPAALRHPRARPARALSIPQQQAVLDLLHAPGFVDQAPTALSGLRSCCASSYLQRRDTTVSGQQRRGWVTIARSTRRARLAYGRAYWCRRREDDFGEPTRSFETSSSRFWTARARSVAGSMKWQAKQEKQKKAG